MNKNYKEKPYREELFDKYFSSHYSKVIPPTKEGWEWVIERIDINFGDIISSLPKNAAILDVGCGVGYLIYYLVKKGFSNIHAIDVSQEQINVAKDCLRKYGVDYEGSVKFAVTDAFDFITDNSGYDVIAMLDILDHFDKERSFELMKLAFDSLNSSGIFISRTTNMNNPLSGQYYYCDFTHESGFTPNSINQCLNAVGFKNIQVYYEKIPFSYKEKQSVRRRLKKRLRGLKFNIMAKFLGIGTGAFSENIMVIARP